MEVKGQVCTRNWGLTATADEPHIIPHFWRYRFHIWEIGNKVINVKQTKNTGVGISGVFSPKYLVTPNEICQSENWYPISGPQVFC